MNKIRNYFYWLPLPFINLYLTVFLYSSLFVTDVSGGPTYETRRMSFLLFELFPINIIFAIGISILYVKTKNKKYLILIPLSLLASLLYAIVRIKYIGIY
jgi:hypothetical protein